MSDGKSGENGAPASDASPDADRVREALRGVIDPEVGLDVVTMGLIYGVEVEGGTVRIRYALTTEGCPMADVIRNGIVHAARRVSGVEDVETELVREPAWHPGMMEEDAP